MKKVKYDSGRPIMRLETGDEAVIRVTHFPASVVDEKDKEKYKDVPAGRYKAICTGHLRLECQEHPVLSGKYNYWRGDKWGCSEGIYADEPGK